LKPALLRGQPRCEAVLCPLVVLRLLPLLGRVRRLLGPGRGRLLLLLLSLRQLEGLLLWLLLWELLLWLDLLVGHGGRAVVARVPRGGRSAPWVDLLPGVHRWQGGVCARGWLVCGDAERAAPVCDGFVALGGSLRSARPAPTKLEPEWISRAGLAAYCG
jgi:hypothetical protein